MFKQFLVVAAVAGTALSMTAQADTAVTENTTVGATGFIDLTSLDARAAGVKTAASGFGLDVKRFYLIANHTFDDVWSANLTTDFNYISASGETQVFIKKAYLQAKLSDAFVVRAGSADLPWIPFTEATYGYRYVEQVVVDRLKFGTSADWGIHAGGKFADGMVSYAVSTVEGNGYKNPTRSKSLDWEGRISVVPVKGLTAALGFYSGKLGKDIEASTTPALHTAQRFNALLAYATDRFNVGGEYFTADNWTAVTAVAKDSADGYSVWGAVAFTPQVSAFARVDSAKPNKDTAPSKKDDYFNLGLSTKPRKGVDLALVYKHDELKNGSTTLSKFDEYGVWAQVRF
jgi:hypothetical protein